MLRTVFLIGFMGAGKTSLGKRLAPRLQLDFIDLDEAVAKRYEVEKVQFLIKEKGVDFFRNAETETLQSLDVSGKLIAAGGGTPCFSDNMEWMKARGLVIYISVDEKTLLNRLLQTNLEERPLLKGADETALRDFIHLTLQERLPYYRQASLTYNPLKQKPEELIEAIRTAII